LLGELLGIVYFAFLDVVHLQIKTVGMKATSSFDYHLDGREPLKLVVLGTFEWAYKTDII